MFECFKSKQEQMRVALRKRRAIKRYNQIAGLLGAGKEDTPEVFERAKEIVRLASTIDNASCGCEVCAALRLERRKL